MATKRSRTFQRRIQAYLVHLLTASGLIFAFLAAVELISSDPKPWLFFLWLLCAVIIDAIDGPFARRLQVTKYAPHISGRTIDDIIDYLTFTFLPLLFVWKMGWLPEPAGVYTIIAMMASVFGFGNTRAKQEAEGFFLGFPSYWNIYAFYAGVWYYQYGSGPVLLFLLLLVGLTFLPMQFIYPNRAPWPWRTALLYGAGAWILLLLSMLVIYPAVPEWLMWVSLIYPIFYCVLSVGLDLKARASR